MTRIRYNTLISRTLLTLCLALGLAFAQTAEAQISVPGFDRESGIMVEPGPMIPGTAAERGGPIDESWQESFEDITELPADGWHLQNNSDPIGTTGWFQGTPGSPIPPHDGEGYIGANFNNTSGSNTISNWLLTPEIVLQNGTTISFWTVSANSQWPDRLEFRLSLEGESTDVGTTAESVGDFGIVILTINEGLTQGGYPGEWTQYEFELDGLDEATSGRFAFRYYVTDGGPAGNNSDYIGIDLVEVFQPGISTEGSATAGSLSLSSVFPNPVTGVSRVELDVVSAQHISIEVFNVLGQRVATVFEGMASAGTSGYTLDGSRLSSGMYIVRVSGEDFTQSRRFVVSN